MSVPSAGTVWDLPFRTGSENLPQGNQWPGAEQALATPRNEPATFFRKVLRSGVAPV